jgi:DNA/RNA endonuclease YhcR with UshA esterase domain
MRGAARLATLLCALGLAGSIGSADAAVISDQDALRHVGQSVTVEGVVTGTHVSGKGTEFLDFGSRYPSQDFTVVIFSRSEAELGDIARFYGKRLDVSGTIELYRGRPEIIVRSAAQIRIAH